MLRWSSVPVLALTAVACANDTSTAPETAPSVSAGQRAPSFTKSVLGGGTFSLDAELGPVIVLFLFGHACPICIDDGPSLEENVQQHYADAAPGLVKVVGVDLWNGSAAQVEAFRGRTGATFPLLLDGARTAGGNLSELYGPFDNYVVIDGEGTIVYHAADAYAHGNRYHLDEIRDAVDRALASDGRSGAGLRRTGTIG